MTVRPLLIGLRELRSFFADWGNLAFSLLIPVVLLALMLGAFGGELRFSGTAFVVDLDGGPAARELIEALRANDGLRVRLLSEDAAEDRLNRTAILMYARIPAGFSAAIESGAAISITLVRRGNGGGQEGQIVSAYVQDAVQQVGAAQQVEQTTSALLAELGVAATPEQVAAAVNAELEASAETPPVIVEARGAGTEAADDYAAILFPRIAAWMVLFSVTLNAQSLIEERRQGTLERLLTTRLTRDELFTGKFLGNYLRGLAQFLILFAGAALVLEIFTVTSFIYSLLFGMFVLAAIGSLGLVIATVARTPGQATWGAVFATMLLAVFGGTFFDTSTSGVFDVVSKLTPTYWMNEGFDQLILDGANLRAVLPSIFVLSGIAVVGLVVSRSLFRPIAGGSG